MKHIPDPKKMRRVKGPALTRKDLEQAKIRITTYLDCDVLDTLRQLAGHAGSKYQTLLNHILREYLLGQQTGLLARIDRLERAVFKSKAA